MSGQDIERAIAALRAKINTVGGEAKSKEKLDKLQEELGALLDVLLGRMVFAARNSADDEATKQREWRQTPPTG